MIGHKHTLVAIAGVVLLAAAAAAQQAPVAPKPATQRPNDEGAAPKTLGKLVPPVRGQAQIEFTQPQAKQEGNMIVTRMKVKNVSSGTIAGFKVDEFWYNKKGDPVTGSPTFRSPKPLQPGEVIEVTLRVPRHPEMNANTYKFEHANGTIKPTKVPKL
jgi:hypothetical protein